MKIESDKNTIFDVFVAIKGAGDLASGIACRLFNANIRNIWMMEIEKPLAVRRSVSFSEAVYKGEMTIEGITAVFAESTEDIKLLIKQGKIPVVVDPQWKTPVVISPHVLIDAIMAKKNTGTKLTDAKIVLGLGPGFKAGYDVDFVVETKRGHNLGRILYHGMAQKNTSIPEEINNFTSERVIRSPENGFFEAILKIGDMVKKGDMIGRVNSKIVVSQIDGVLRGLIQSGIKVSKHMKIGDVDPRGNLDFCLSVSDKARSLGGAVLEAIMGNCKF